MIPSHWVEQSTIDEIVTLLLPPDWTAEDEEDDGTTSFALEDDEASGVLRVTSLIMEKDTDVTDRELPRLIAKRGPMASKVHADRYVRRLVVEDEEDGEPLIQVTWELVHRLEAREVALIVFSYTLGLSETLESASEFIESLETSIRTCEIDAETEVEPD